MSKVLSACVVLAVLAGCGGPDGPEMVDISGTVTYKGEPIKDGAIRFLPQEGTEARVTPVMIVDGQYSASGKTGLAVGSYKVEFHSYETATAQASSDPAQEGEIIPAMIQKKELLPEKYYRDPQETITIEPGSGSITKDFQLE